MKNSLYVILIILSSTLFELYAQTREIDSLENLLQNHKDDDTVKINLLNETSKKLFRKNDDKMFQYSQKALNLSEELNFKKGKAKSLYFIGAYYMDKSGYSLAINYTQQALEIFEDIDDKEGILTSLNNFGAIYYFQGNYTQALEYFQRSYKISEEIDNKKGASNCLSNIAAIYSNQGNYYRSLEYNQKALKIRKLLDDKLGISQSLNNIGILYIRQGNNEDAMNYFEKSLKIKEDLGDKLGVSITMNNIVNIYTDQANYTKALEYNIKALKIREEIGDKNGIAGSYNDFGIIYGLQNNYEQSLEYHYNALEIRKEIGDKSGICESKHNIGDMYFKLKNNVKALDYTKQSLEIASQLNLLNNQKNIYELLSMIYAAKNNYRKAFENYKLYKELNDSIFNEENIKKITGLKFQYEFDKEKQAIELEQQKKDVIYNHETKRQKTIRNSLIAGFMLMLLLVAVILRSFIQKRRANNNLTLQKKKIEEKNYELLQKNEEIRSQAEQLEDANSTKDKFFSIVAHDLKGPFTAMLGFSKMLINNFDSYDEAKQKEFINFINIGLQNTYKLLEDLLLWSRTQRDVIDFNPSNEKLYLLTNSIILLLNSIAKNKSINIKNEIPKDIVVSADKLMLSTILRNLISNGIKFTPNAGEIIIKAHAITDVNNLNYIEICIQDNGVGIPPARLRRLFKIAENISTLGTEQEEGSGLGLVLCKEFVEQHKGKIWVESELEKGSIFKFILPC